MLGDQLTIGQKGKALKSSRHLSQHLLKTREKDQLAREFPLLFGKTTDDRSTSGKYSNKDYSHRRSVMPIDENNDPNVASTTAAPSLKRASVLPSFSRKKPATAIIPPTKVVCLTSPQPKGVEMLTHRSSITEVGDGETVIAEGPSDMDIVDTVEIASAAETAPVDLLDIYPTRMSDVGTVDDVAVLTALRSFLHKMDANDTIQQTVESHFQKVEAEEVAPPAPMELEDIQALSTEVAAAEVPDSTMRESNARRSSLSSIATELTINSQKSKSSQFCTDHVPVTEQYMNSAVGNRDAVVSSEPAGPEVNPVQSAEASSTLQTTRAEKIVIYPRDNLMLQAMESGLVVADITDYWQRESHVKFIIHVSLLHVPGVSDDYHGHVRMMLMKRFSDFKLLRQNLLISLRENSKESIPPLPTKQVLSMGGESSEEDYLHARQKYLRNWLHAVMARQSVEGMQYRKEIVQFFNE